MNLLNLLRISLLASIVVTNIHHAAAMEKDEALRERQFKFAREYVKEMTKDREIPLSKEEIDEYANLALHKGQRMKEEEARKKKEKKEGKKSSKGKEYGYHRFYIKDTDVEGKPTFYEKKTHYEDGEEVWSEERGEDPLKSKKKNERWGKKLDIQQQLYPDSSLRKRGSEETHEMQVQDINKLVLEFNDNLHNYVQNQMEALRKLEREITPSKNQVKEERSQIDPDSLQNQLLAFTSYAEGSFKNTAVAVHELNKRLLPQMNLSLRKSGEISQKHRIGFPEGFTDFTNYIKKYGEE